MVSSNNDGTDGMWANMGTQITPTLHSRFYNSTSFTSSVLEIY